MPDIIASRIKALRQERGLSQAEVAGLLGFKDRQTVSAIETGVRQVTARELLLATEQLGVSLDYFTDPFRLEGEARFSWRQTGVAPERLTAYENRASRWIGAYRALAGQVGREARLVRPSLGLTKRSRYEDAIEAGERFAAEFELGRVPALRLGAAMENGLGILVLMVDTEPGVSGAACRLPELDAVLIARNEFPGRRHFDLAHELFHVLTWEAMPPKHVEEAAETSRDRVEQLANSFAAAVLMPTAAVAGYGPWRALDADGLVARLNEAATGLRVSASALRWRLAAMGEIPAARARDIPEAAMRRNGGAEHQVVPPRFSKAFVEVLGLALDEGMVSERRAAALVDSDVDELPRVFAAHGIERDIAV